jgi:tellurite methyltransferase
LYLARQGLTATGIDRSRDALESGREAATRANLKASFVQADLTRFALPRGAFSVVICFKYRDRIWYPSIRAALRPGGLLIFETYTLEHRKYGHKPLDPAHLLERHELLQAFGDWEIIFYREVWIGRGAASLVARKPAPHAEC